jgi:hypothetical protein
VALQRACTVQATTHCLAALLALIPHLAIGEYDATCCCCCCCCCCFAAAAAAAAARWPGGAFCHIWQPGRAIVIFCGHAACSHQHLLRSSSAHPSHMCNSMCPHVRTPLLLSAAGNNCSFTGGGRCCYISKVSVLLDSTLEAMVGSVHMPVDSVCALPRGSVPPLCHYCC